MDVHIPAAITEQLRLRDVEVLAAIEEGTNRLEDHELLELATRLGRVVVTQDIRFRVLAENWQREQRPSRIAISYINPGFRRGLAFVRTLFSQLR